MNPITKIFFSFLLLVFAATAFAQNKVSWKKVTVLVYTKNGKGYVHDNIPTAVAAIQKLGKDNGFKVDTSANSGVMTETNLKQYTLLIFASTNNDVFDTDVQRLAFRRYIEAGGGFVGIHSVTGTERNWTWFKNMMGGTFVWHAKFQEFKIKVLDPLHPSMQGLPKEFEKEDEFYFAKELYPGTKTIMAGYITSLNTTDSTQRNLIQKNAGGFAELYPLAWTHDFDGGHTWFTTLGHDKKDYTDPLYLQHILQGIRFIASQVKQIDNSKSYADSRDAPVKY